MGFSSVVPLARRAATERFPVPRLFWIAKGFFLANP